MADDLGALGEVVTDRMLVLNVIRDLNERFTHVGALLRRARPFPSFLDAREDLTLEELTMANQQPSLVAALTVTTRFSQLSPQPSGSNSGGAGHGNNSKNNSRRSKRGGSNGGGGQQQ
jgi:uncharacterized membrane protein YgcG